MSCHVLSIILHISTRRFRVSYEACKEWKEEGSESRTVFCEVCEISRQFWQFQTTFWINFFILTSLDDKLEKELGNINCYKWIIFRFQDRVTRSRRRRTNFAIAMLDLIVFFSLEFAVLNSLYRNTILKPKQVSCLKNTNLGYNIYLIVHAINIFVYHANSAEI